MRDPRVGSDRAVLGGPAPPVSGRVAEALDTSDARACPVERANPRGGPRNKEIAAMCERTVYLRDGEVGIAT